MPYEVARLNLADATLSGGAQLKAANGGRPQRLTVADPIAINANGAIVGFTGNNNNNTSSGFWDSTNAYYWWMNGSGTVSGVAHVIYCFDVRTGNRVTSFAATGGGGHAPFEDPRDANVIWTVTYTGTNWVFHAYSKAGAYLGAALNLVGVTGQNVSYIFTRPGDTTYCYGKTTAGTMFRITLPVIGATPTINSWTDGSAYGFWRTELTGKLVVSRNANWREIDGTGATVYEFSVTSGAADSQFAGTKIVAGLGPQFMAVPGTDHLAMVPAQSPNARHWHLFDIANRTQLQLYWESHNYTAFAPYDALSSSGIADPGTRTINPTQEYIVVPSTRGSAAFATQWVVWRLGVQRARWSYLANANLTWKGLQAPGAHGGSVLASGNTYWPDDRPVYWYYSTDGGSNRTQFDPSEEQSLSVSSGQTLTIDADFRDPRGRRPGDYWIGGSTNNGLVLWFDNPSGGGYTLAADGTTTLTTIISNMKTVLEGLTPTKLTDKKYRRATRRVPLRELALTNGGSGLLREFEITRDGVVQDPSILDPAMVMRVEDVTVTVAYPAQVALYGVEDLDSMEDIVRRDAAQLYDAIFNPDNYVTGQNGAIPEIGALERDGDVWFQTIRVRVHFNEAVTVQ